MNKAKQGWWRSGAVMVALCLLPAAASADMGPRLSTGWYGLGGITTGVAIHPDRPTAAVVGAEASLSWLDTDSLWWAGATADTVYDFSPDHWRVSVGPHLGRGPLGLDIGGVAAFTRDGVVWGVQVRPVLTMGIFAVYGRRLQFPTGPETERHAGEIGLILKAPFLAPPPRKRPLPGPERGDPVNRTDRLPGGVVP